MTSGRKVGDLPWPAAQSGTCVCSAAQQKPDDIPDVPVLPNNPASPAWKEPLQEDDKSSGEPVESGSGGDIDWGSPRLQAHSGPMDDEFADWSSHSSSEEWE